MVNDPIIYELRFNKITLIIFFYKTWGVTKTIRAGQGVRSAIRGETGPRRGVVVRRSGRSAGTFATTS